MYRCKYGCTNFLPQSRSPSLRVVSTHLLLRQWPVGCFATVMTHRADAHPTYGTVHNARCSAVRKSPTWEHAERFSPTADHFHGQGHCHCALGPVAAVRMRVFLSRPVKRCPILPKQRVDQERDSIFRYDVMAAILDDCGSTKTEGTTFPSRRALAIVLNSCQGPQNPYAKSTNSNRSTRRSV